MNSIREKAAMHRIGAVAAMAALAQFITVQSTSAQSELGFKTPSRNIYCIVEQADGTRPTDLRCDIQQMNNRMPASAALRWLEGRQQRELHW